MLKSGETSSISFSAPGLTINDRRPNLVHKAVEQFFDDQLDHFVEPSSGRMMRSECSELLRTFSAHSGKERDKNLAYLPTICSGSQRDFIGLNISDQPRVAFHDEARVFGVVVTVSKNRNLCADDVMRFMEMIGEITESYYGHHSTYKTFSRITKSLNPNRSPSQQDLKIPKRTLEVILSRPVESLPVIGWINYWSKKTLEYGNVTSAVLQNMSIYRYYETTSGALVLQLAHDPLSLDNPIHVELLEDMYRLFEY